MSTKEDYAATLSRLHVKACTALLDKGKHLQINKVASVVVVGELRDELEAHYGKGKVPIEALLAMRDHMARGA